MEISIDICIGGISELGSVLTEVENLRKENPDAMYKINIWVHEKEEI